MSLPQTRHLRIAEPMEAPVGLHPEPKQDCPLHWKYQLSQS